MRPQILDALFKPVLTLKGVGPKVEQKITRIAGPALVDLCWHLPSGLIDRTYQPSIAEAQAGRIATLKVTVDKHTIPPQKRLPYKIRVFDDTGFLTLTFFHGNKDYLTRTLPENETRIISGKIERYGNEIQMVHPDLIVKPEELDTLPLIEPVHPLTEGLSPKTLRHSIEQALDQMPDLPEWQDAAFLARENWPTFKNALLACHHPQILRDLELDTVARQRLAYDEILAHQLSLAIVRQKMKTPKGRPLRAKGNLVETFLKNLPFPLTGHQQRSIEEITQNMGEPTRMIRLLQGDVGAGKTVVALAALLIAIDAGAQGAFMSPTEILALQHLKTATELLAGLDINIGFLSGRSGVAERREVQEKLESGEIQLMIGTHALFQEKVTFKDLGLAVIDEQHRFGVHQRMVLSEKGNRADVLVMTATPIPRTLALTLYGDMDVSILREKPKGRKSITTVAIPMERLDEVVKSVQRSIDHGVSTFWVCPLIEESDVFDITAATDRFEHLEMIFPGQVGLMHGRLTNNEKDEVLEKFLSGQIKVLVSTTVIEVGVDIPHANVIVIEQAERFGLAQLHQLRGRVGRGREQANCILLYQSPLGETAKARLAIMRKTNDGFRIAEEDLKIRGVGDLLGTRQSGLPLFHLADLEAHRHFLTMAHDDARLILNKDEDLSSERGKALRLLLYLFRHDEKILLLRSG